MVPDILCPLNTPSSDCKLSNISILGPTNPVTDKVQQCSITMSQGDTPASATIDTYPLLPSLGDSENSETALLEQATPSSEATSMAQGPFGGGGVRSGLWLATQCCKPMLNRALLLLGGTSFFIL